MTTNDQNTAEITAAQQIPADCLPVNPRDTKSRTRQPLAPIVGTILAIGLVLTGAVGLFYRYQETTQIQETLAGESDVFIASLDDGFARAASAYDTLLSSSSSSWPSQSIFAASFGAISRDLPGDTAAALIVSVEPSSVMQFARDERAENPDFELLFLNDDPSDYGHLLFMRSSDDSQTLGIDVGSFGTEVASSLGNSPVITFAAGDFRSPAATSSAQNLQVIVPGTVAGPSGNDVRAWVIGQIDTVALLEEALAGVSPALRVEVQVTASGMELNAVSAGRPQSSDFQARAFRSIESNGLNASVRLVTTGEMYTGTTPRTVLVWGGAFTALAALLASLLLFIRSLTARVDVSETRALSDELTSLPNRRWLLSHLTERWEQSPDSIGLFFCDLDRFKVVNDSLGHNAGDELLRGFAERLTGTLQPGQHLVRFGGDEFIVCAEFPAVTCSQDSKELAERILNVTATPFAIYDKEFATTVSVGIAHHQPGTQTSPEDLIREADTALFQAKRRGRDGFVVFDDELRNEALGRLDVERDLRRALNDGSLELHYQPLVDVTGALRSFEALVRWRRDGALIAPDDFLPVLAELNLMPQLGSLVLDQALGQLRLWLDSIPSASHHLTMHVNVDPQEFCDVSYATKVAAALETHGVAPHHLVLEITEQALPDVDHTEITVMRELQGLGVGMAVDDFGTGHSSLSRLVDVPGLTEMKIDRAISVRAQDSSVMRAVVTGAITVARELQLTVVAEGIETPEEHEALARLGVDTFQGWHHGRPAPAAECQVFLAALREAPPESPLETSQIPDNVAQMPPLVVRAETPPS